MSNYYKRRYGYQTPWRWWRDNFYCIDKNTDFKIESEKQIANDRSPGQNVLAHRDIHNRDVRSALFYIMPFFLIAMLVWKVNTK